MVDVEWIKLSTDIFTNRKMKQIQMMKEGDELIIIWIKLLVLAGILNENGFLYITKNIPYDAETLSTEIKRSVEMVNLALETFLKWEMIEIVDGVIHILNWEKYQNVEGLEKIREQTKARVARYRAKENDVTLRNVTVTLPVTQCNATDKEEDIEEDKERELLDSMTFSAENVRCNQGDMQRIIEAWNTLGLQQVTKITPNTQREKMLKARIKTYGVDEILKAIENVRSSNFLNGNNKKGWTITFDWFIKPNNYLKVHDGNYNDSKNQSQQSVRKEREFFPSEL